MILWTGSREMRSARKSEGCWEPAMSSWIWGTGSHSGSVCRNMTCETGKESGNKDITWHKVVKNGLHSGRESYWTQWMIRQAEWGESMQDWYFNPLTLRDWWCMVMKNVGGPDDLPEGICTHFLHVACGLVGGYLVHLLSYSRTFFRCKYVWVTCGATKKWNSLSVALNVLNRRMGFGVGETYSWVTIFLRPKLVIKILDIMS